MSVVTVEQCPHNIPSQHNSLYRGSTGKNEECHMSYLVMRPGHRHRNRQPGENLEINPRRGIECNWHGQGAGCCHLNCLMLTWLWLRLLVVVTGDRSSSGDHWNQYYLSEWRAADLEPVTVTRRLVTINQLSVTCHAQHNKFVGQSQNVEFSHSKVKCQCVLWRVMK